MGRPAKTVRDADRIRTDDGSMPKRREIMSVNTAMYSGISGLFANGESMSVIGNNISNVNTIGFKGGRTVFSDMLSTTTNNSQVGSGVQLQTVQNLFNQGSFENTTNATDLAIQGDAFFVVRSPNGTGQFYTRAGAFSFDKNQELVNADGYQVLGYGMTNGSLNGAFGPISLAGFNTQAPVSTSNITVSANLDSNNTPPVPVWDPTLPNFNPNTASNFSTTSTVYDQLGNAKSLTLYFTNTGANSWDVYTYDGTTYTAAGAGTPLAFNANGTMASVNGVAGGTTFAVNGITVDLAGTTQFTGSSVVNSMTHDGYPAGSLTKINVDQQGYVNGVYSNGQQQRLARVALATFESVDGLEKVGGTLFGETFSSGNALIGSADLVRNKVLSSSLEQSNVDMSEQLVKMITTQRAYSANGKTITTSDEMLQETLNLKR